MYVDSAQRFMQVHHCPTHYCTPYHTFIHIFMKIYNLKCFSIIVDNSMVYHTIPRHSVIDCLSGTRFTSITCQGAIVTWLSNALLEFIIGFHLARVQGSLCMYTIILPSN